MNTATQKFSEIGLIERNAIELLAQLGWETADCYQEKFGQHSTLGREAPADVVPDRKTSRCVEAAKSGSARGH